MNYTTLHEAHDDLIMLLKSQSLYPVIGAGFSTGCSAKNGKAPSGDELRAEMLQQINQQGYDSKELEVLDLKKISRYYKTIIPRSVRTQYLLNNFTDIVLPDYASSFLQVNWKYIYTFNIDTAIEDNSEYKNVILPNRQGDDKNISRLNHCVFKYMEMYMIIVNMRKVNATFSTQKSMCKALRKTRIF